MRLRTVALAMALIFGAGAIAEAKKAPVHKTKIKKMKQPKAHKAAKHPAPKHRNG